MMNDNQSNVIEAQICFDKSDPVIKRFYDDLGSAFDSVPSGESLMKIIGCLEVFKADIIRKFQDL